MLLPPPGPQPQAPPGRRCRTHVCFPSPSAPVPRQDSPSDARPCTPQPAPPTPRARRCGQQRPIICRQRLLKRVGCWLENGAERGLSRKLLVAQHPEAAPLSCLPHPHLQLGLGPHNHPAAQVRNLGSSLTLPHPCRDLQSLSPEKLFHAPFVPPPTFVGARVVSLPVHPATLLTASPSLLCSLTQSFNKWASSVY